MKILHCADLHLDSSLRSNLPTAKSRERKKEIVNAFCRLVDFAKKNKVTAVIIAGDLFDTNRMLLSTRDLVLGQIESCQDTDFLYLCGNHDAGKSLAACDLPKNLKLFNDRWTEYSYGNVSVLGVELTGENCRHIYGSLQLDKAKFNIVTMHGELSTASGEDAVNRFQLADKGIDYLALGHYHSYDSGALDKKGIWCYPGCLEGRGFDECGDKGFVLLEIAEDNSFKYDFVKHSVRNIAEIEVDISGISDTALMLNAIETAVDGLTADTMLKVVLKGGVSADARKDLEFFEKHLNDRFWFAKVRDNTHIELNPDDYKNDISLKGEFIRAVLSAGLAKEECDKVIECGLAALSGQEVL